MSTSTHPHSSTQDDQTERGIIAWFTRNSVAANLLMIILVLGGLYSALVIKKEMFPAFELNIIDIRVPYPGAAPKEVEQGVIVRIEEAIEDLEGIKTYRSTAREGMGSVQVEVDESYDTKELLDLVEQRVNAIPTLPENIERPAIYQIKAREEIINVQLYGDMDEASMKLLGQTIKDEIANLPGITTVEMWGARDYEVAVELSAEKLEEYDLSFDAVATAIRRASLDLPSGQLKTPTGNILLRVNEQAYRGVEFGEIVIRSQLDGTQIKVKDVARVIDGFEERENRALFNGKNSIGINVFAVGDQNALKISETVKKYITAKKAELPDSVTVDHWADRSFYLKGRLEMMLGNMWSGALLVFIVLALFLEVRVAFWVILGLPICFLGAMFLMPIELIGVSINVLSLFGFILVLGIVVDDAIIIGESAYTEIEKSGQSIKSVIKGTQKVAMPATFGVLTTIAAFTPMLMVGGVRGVIWASIAWVVVLCLCFSLIESKLILPAHLAHLDGMSRFGRLIHRVLNFFKNYRFERAVGGATLSRFFMRTLVAVKIMLFFVPVYIVQKNRGRDVSDAWIMRAVGVERYIGLVLGYAISLIQIMPYILMFWCVYHAVTWLLKKAKHLLQANTKLIAGDTSQQQESPHNAPKTMTTGFNPNLWLRNIAEQKYSRWLTVLMKYRYATLATFVGILVVSIALVASGRVRSIAFPDLPSDFVQVNITMEDGTSSLQTNQALDQLENALFRLDTKLQEEFGESVVKHTFSWMRSDVSGQIFAELSKSETRDDSVLNSKILVDRWRDETPDIAGVKSLKFNASIGPGGGGADLSFRLQSKNLAELELAVKDLEKHMASFEGVYDISNSFAGGKQEIQLSLTPQANLLGLSLMDVARQVRNGFYGAEVQRIQRDREEVKVMVRYPLTERSSIGNLESLKIRLANGERVPFSAVANIKTTQGYGQIQRVDGRRAVTVEAVVNKAIAEPFTIATEIDEDFMPSLKQTYSSLEFELEGASKEEAESYLKLLAGFVFALFVIYGLLAIPLKSYLQPVIVMSVIPFGIIGAIVGHLLTGHDLSMLSTFGIIALSGVVVNDSLILVDFVNRAKAEGMATKYAALSAGVQRFRAIILTSLTTFMGLAPIIFFESSLQAKIVQPMAVSLAFGIVFATMITLALVPCLYVMIDELKAIIKRKIGGGPSDKPVVSSQTPTS